MSTIDQIDTVLRTLENEVAGQIEGALIASGDGFVIANTLRDEDAEEIAAMVATTMGVSTRMSAALSAGEVTETSIQGDSRSIFLYRAGTEGVLAVVAPEEANVGMINIRAREAAEQVRSHLENPSQASA
jgi:predicted regulator of Ras-like GTPase activity (Roadblock/LC7/MglB family)